MEKLDYIFLPRHITEEILTRVPFAERDYLHQNWCGEPLCIRVSTKQVRIDVCASTSTQVFPLIIIHPRHLPNYIHDILNHLTI